MAGCVSPTGSIGFGAFTLDNVLTEWLPLALSAYIAYEMMTTAEEAEKELEKIGKTSLDSAECLFDKYMELRSRDEEVIEFANNQPLYKPCDTSAHAIQGSRQATDFLKTAMGSMSRFDCGAKQKAIRLAQRAFMLSSMQEQEELIQHEMNIEDSYYASYYDSIMSVNLPDATGSLVQGFGASAAIWEGQAANANTQAAGALQSVGYFGNSAFNLFKGN